MTNNDAFDRIIRKREEREKETRERALIDAVQLSDNPPKDIRVQFRDYRKNKLNYRAPDASSNIGQSPRHGRGRLRLRKPRRGRS